MEIYKVNDRSIVRFDEPDGVEYWPAKGRQPNHLDSILQG